jgi:hypothetical protein
VQCPAHHEWGLSPHTDNTDAPDAMRQQGKRGVTLMTLKGVHGFRPSNEEISTSRQHDSAPHGRHESDKEPPFSPFFCSYRHGTYTFRPRVSRYGLASPPISWHLGATRTRLASIQENCTRFLFSLVLKIIYKRREKKDRRDDRKRLYSESHK